MNSTKVKSGRSVTLSSTAEVQIDINGPHGAFPVLTLELISGSYQYATANKSADPVIDGTYTVLSTANDKKLVTIEPDVEPLRLKSAAGAAVIHISY